MKRKDFLTKGIGFLGTSLIAPSLLAKKDDSAACAVTNTETAGPFPTITPSNLVTSNIVGDRTGVPFTINIYIMNVNANCAAYQGVLVDIWHCDKDGEYSGYSSSQNGSHAGETFCRGLQKTDSSGKVTFTTIYPGWYPIRTVHVHFKIRTAPISRRSYEFTSQVYFPDNLTDHVHTASPYSSNGRRRVRNQQDFIYRYGGEHLLLEPSETSNGYTATFPIALTLP